MCAVMSPKSKKKGKVEGLMNEKDVIKLTGQKDIRPDDLRDQKDPTAKGIQRNL